MRVRGERERGRKVSDLILDLKRQYFFGKRNFSIGDVSKKKNFFNGIQIFDEKFFKFFFCSESAFFGFARFRNMKFIVKQNRESKCVHVCVHVRAHECTRKKERE